MLQDRIQGDLVHRRSSVHLDFVVLECQTIKIEVILNKINNN